MGNANIALNGEIKNVALGKMHALSDHAQREKRNQGHVDHLVNHMDLDKIGLPVLSEKDGAYYIIDGQHRIEALRIWLGDGSDTQKIPCRIYSGLTEDEEAELFLDLNKTLQVGTFDKFRVALNAGREEENHINAVVMGAGLRVSRDNVPGGIRAVGTLRKVYRRSDASTLARTLRIIRDAYGDAGFQAKVIDGIAHVCQRYNGALDEDVASDKLGKARGSVNGLIARSENLHKQTGNLRSHCVAAAAVDIINTGRGSKKLPSWWKEQ